MKKGLYKFNADCGRQGFLSGLFISTEEKINKLIESEIEVYFGEVLGKHSEIFGAIDIDDISLITNEKIVIDIFENYELESGYNPFHYTSFNCEGKYEDQTIDEIITDLLKK